MNIEEKKLYPMRFCALRDEYGWGSEEFAVADLGYRDTMVREGWLGTNTLSEVMDTYMDRVIGEIPYDYYGRQFPVQIKHICCKGKMPVRVNPDDEISEQRYDSLGREKFWYILKASADARIVLGFKADTDAAEVLAGAGDGRIEENFNLVRPVAGECIRVKPGTVHGALGDVEIVEISSSSALDFCIYSWGEPVSDEEFDPALTPVDALDFIDYGAYKAEKEPHHHHDGMITHLTDIPQFTANKIALKDPLHIYSDKFESFMLYFGIYGEASVGTEMDGVKMLYPVKPGEVLLVPADVADFYLTPSSQNVSLIEVYVEKRPDDDPYINPDVPAHLPEDEEDDDCCCGHDHEHDEDGCECGCGHHHHHEDE